MAQVSLSKAGGKTPVLRCRVPAELQEKVMKKARLRKVHNLSAAVRLALEEFATRPAAA